MELAAFGISAVVVWRQGWTAGELVWALWFSSLAVGLVTLLVWFAGRLRVGQLSALALLLFFVLHYGLFHLVHAVFLALFFGLGIGGSGQGLVGGGLGFDALSLPALLSLLATIWPVLLVSLASERGRFARAWGLTTPGEALSYRSVIKMHVLIIFLGFWTIALQEQRLVLLIVLLFHFFPLEALLAAWQAAKRPWDRSR